MLRCISNGPRLKLVVKLGSCSLTGRFSETFGHSVSDLLNEGHRVVIVDGSNPAYSLSSSLLEVHRNVHSSDIDPSRNHGQNAVLPGEDPVSRRVVVMLGKAGVASFFFWPSDGNADGKKVRIRRRSTRAIWPLIEFEAAAVDPFWLETISAKGGVPVIVNAFLGCDQQYHWLDGDQLAAKCAIGWQADIVIFLTKSKGLRNSDGSVMRLLENNRISELAKDGTLANSMLSKFLACDDALKQGVGRTIILPLHGLEEFSPLLGSSQLMAGTEVVRSEVQLMRYTVDYRVR